MSGASDDRWLVPAGWPWRVILFAGLVALIVGIERLVEAWFLPSAAATLGVRQLLASEQAAESLRTFEWARHALPTVAGGLIAVAGLAMFVPLPRRFVQWLRETFA